MATPNLADTRQGWQQLHDAALVWLLHDHFHHRLDETLAMQAAGVTAKTAVPVGDLAIYNDSDDPDHLGYYQRTLDQTVGWGRESLARVERARRLLESCPAEIVVATRASDVRTARESGRVAVFLGMEGCKAFEGSLGLLDEFHDLGVRQMQLTWANPNQLVDAADGSWRLSRFGRQAVSRMEELGVVIDVAHAPWSLVLDVAEVAEGPLVVSHGAPSDPHPGSGDIPREYLDLLLRREGVLGLHFCRHYINGPHATFEDFLETIDWLVVNGYEDIVALGGDLFEVDDYFRARHPAPTGSTHETWSVFVDEIDSVRKMPNTTRALCARGHPEPVVRKILGENVMRVYRRALGG